MKVQDIRPVIHRLFYFNYVEREHKYAHISSDKSQYVYHMLLIDKGALDVCIGGKTQRVEAGDAVYLLPGDVYRLLPCGEAFSLYNLFFDFLDDRFVPENKQSGCVLMKHYDGSRCLPRVEFQDAPILNKSGIIRHLPVEKTLKPLLYRDRRDGLYGFHGRAALFSLIAELLAPQDNRKKTLAAEQILAYIKTNPEKDLSGDALSKLFSYHKNHINKLVKQETGRALSEYIRYVKIEHAKDLLSEGACCLAEISERLGYYDYSHFYKAFYAETGITPAEYVRRS